MSPLGHHDGDAYDRDSRVSAARRMITDHPASALLGALMLTLPDAYNEPLFPALPLLPVRRVTLSQVCLCCEEFARRYADLASRLRGYPGSRYAYLPHG